MHDPASVEEANTARAAGGTARNRPAPADPVDLGSVEAQLAEIEATINRVRAGDETLGVARLVLYGVSLARPLVELSELQRRIERLEATIVEATD